MATNSHERYRLSLPRFIRLLVFLVPSYVILRLHRLVFNDDFSAIYDNYDFIAQMVAAPDAGVPRMSHGAFADFSSSRTRGLSSGQGYYPHNTSTTENLSGVAYIRSSEENAGASVPLRSNASGLLTSTALQNLTKREFLRTRYSQQEERKQAPRRRRRRRGRIPRPGSDGDVTAWVRRRPAEDITTFSYIPVGRYANSTISEQYKHISDKNDANSSSPYAYAFVMGGVDEQSGHYLGMFYNILIAAYILDKEGSTADVVAYVQMSANSTLSELPEDNTRLLEHLGVKIRYLPKPKVENFHQIIMQKMVILELVQYRRVLFLDTDVMPLCNLDYVFHLSDGPEPILKDNLIIALSGSPGMIAVWQGKLYTRRTSNVVRNLTHPLPFLLIPTLSLWAQPTQVC
jgi:hypothetical protein